MLPHTEPLLAPPAPSQAGGTYSLLLRRLIVQVVLQDVNGFNLGYEGVWPLSAAGVASSIAEATLRSDNPLTNPPGSRFTYSYPFAAAGDAKAFNERGGYYQVICAGNFTCLKKYMHRCWILYICSYLACLKGLVATTAPGTRSGRTAKGNVFWLPDSAQAAQVALQQTQPPSRYPPWFVPMPVIADRRTISAVVDFFVMNPLTETFSHCAVLFSFTSAGKTR